VQRGFSFQVRESYSLICDHSPSQMEHSGLIAESGPVPISKLRKGGLSSWPESANQPGIEQPDERLRTNPCA
jgi:hypothetical protein